jgi:hypothetical protein
MFHAGTPQNSWKMRSCGANTVFFEPSA